MTACPACGRRLVTASEGAKRISACLSCGWTSDNPANATGTCLDAIPDRPTAPGRVIGRVKQGKLPGLQPGPQHNAVHEREEPIQQRIVCALRQAGYTVLSTVHRHRMHHCSKCGHSEWHRGDYGADPGVPDLLIRGDDWGARWLALECKGTKTALSDAQKRLLAAGAIVVVRSVADAMQAVQAVEEENV